MGDDRQMPIPRNPTDRLLNGIYDRLGELLDRLPAAQGPAGDGTVELREPGPAARAPAGGKEGQPPSPSGDPGPGPGAQVQRPARPSSKPANSARKRTPKKEN